MPDENSETPKEAGVLREYFHKENIDTIDYLIDNINNGNEKLDALLYFYPYMIYRYTSNHPEFPLPTI